MKILIIESDPSFAQTAADALQALGVEPLIVHDGQEGMNLAREERPAAVILSVELGDRLHGGFSWCNRIKKDEELKDIPLLLVSSLATEDTFEQHRRLKTRADEYLIKPFPTDRLLERVEAMVPALARAQATADEAGLPAAADEDDPFGLDLDLGDDDEPLFGPLDGLGDETLVEGSAEAALLEDEPAVAPTAASPSSPAGPPTLAAPASMPPALPSAGSQRDPLEELDLEELFSDEGTERFAPDPLGWQDLVGADDAPPTDGPPPPVDDGAASAAAERATEAEQRATEAEARIQSLERLLEDTRAELDATNTRLQQALASQREAMEEQDRLQMEASTTRASLQEAQADASKAQAEAGKAEERARRAVLARDEALRKAEALEAQSRDSLDWKARAEEAERSLAEHRARLEGLQRRLQEDELVRQRAQKAVAVAAELLQTLGRSSR